MLLQNSRNYTRILLFFFNTNNYLYYIVGYLSHSTLSWTVISLTHLIVITRAVITHYCYHISFSLLCCISCRTCYYRVHLCLCRPCVLISLVIFLILIITLSIFTATFHLIHYSPHVSGRVFNATSHNPVH